MSRPKKNDGRKSLGALRKRHFNFIRYSLSRLMTARPWMTAASVEGCLESPYSEWLSWVARLEREQAGTHFLAQPAKREARQMTKAFCASEGSNVTGD
jgi:hypothetical protein